MKNLLPVVLIITFCTNLFAQTTFTQLPETPLTYLGYEVTSPAIKSGYTKRAQFFGVKPTVMQIGLILQTKYADLPLYKTFSESSEFFGLVESQTTVARTTEYVAYTLQARASTTDPFKTYAKDTFFLSGTTITTISETIYDTESSIANEVETYAQYVVSYHANGKINSIKLKDGYNGYDLIFAGASAVYNANNTLKTDTTYQYGYDGLGNRKVNVIIYQDHYYKSANALQLDSTFYFQRGSNPELNTKFSYTLNANNEILEALGHTYSSSNNTFEKKFYYDFGQESSLGVFSPSSTSTVSLYPNPVEDLIHIPLDCPFQSWSITSITGESIKSGTNSDLNKISVADLYAGVYVITLTNNAQTWTGKFIK